MERRRILDVDATCTEKGKEYYICNSCSNEDYNETPALGHDYIMSYTPLNNIEHTWKRACQREGCTWQGTTGTANHSGADCTNSVACPGCGYIQAPLGHDWTVLEYLFDNETTHLKYQECSRCDEILAVRENHTGGIATCTQMATCSMCNRMYGSTNPNNHTMIMIAATCTEDAHYDCCGLIISNTALGHLDEDNDYICDRCSANLGSSHTHTYSWTSNGDGTHTGICSCSDTTTQNCSDNNQDGRCDVCNGTMGSSHTHTYNWVSNGNGTHTGTCSCGDSTTQSCSDSDGNGTCDICGGTIGGSHTHTYINYQDNGDNTHTGTCSCGNKLTEAHIDNSSDGICDKCNAIIAEIGDIEFSYTPQGQTNGPVIVTISYPTQTSGTDEYSLDGNTWQAYTGPISILQNGIVYARQEANGKIETLNISNIIEAKITMEKNIEAPTAGPIEVVINYETTAIGTVNEYSINGNTWQTYTGPINVTQNNTTVYARIREISTNTNFAQEQMEITNIIENPQYESRITFTKEPDTQMADEVKVTINYETNIENPIYEYKIGNGSWKSAENILNNGEYVINVTQNNTRIYARIVDESGNTIIEEQTQINNIITQETPTEPENPDNPNDPESPVDPENPGDPENPDDPDNPNDPENPGDPENPDDPDNPDAPDEPSVPGETDEPNDEPEGNTNNMANNNSNTNNSQIPYAGTESTIIGTISVLAVTAIIGYVKYNKYKGF